ncbi:phage head protein [Burkholderia cepacia]|uniref:Phage head protein n=1 Tax=Burkholderia cepacia TaxID=292 RepID=A0A2S8I1A4_BURCE|nr:head completion/stabilization protein [Burkholderia cepacia]PQP08501.1 phage head protein [Burkholderia cepacia]HDR9511807.1 head completion/stabilization protein [Burkholderia cepacia]
MSSFIAPAQTTAGAPGAAATIANDGWFPDIDIADLRESTKIDGTVTAERLRRAVIEAISTVNDDLAEWRAVQSAAGHADLASVPAKTIDGVSIQVSRYVRAVYSLTHADITEKYAGYDSTKSGGQKAESLEDTVCTSRRNARWAMNDIRGIRRSTIELI